MPPTADLQNLPAPLAFVGGVLLLLVWFVREVTKLVKEWNDEARTDLGKEREKRTALEAEHAEDIRELTTKVAALEQEVSQVREDLVAQLREAHEVRVRGIRREQQLLDVLAAHKITAPPEVA